MSADDNVAAVHRAVDHMNRHDLDAYMELYADDVVLHGFPPPVEDFASVQAFYEGFVAALPDLVLTIDDVIADGDMLALRYSVRGTHQGELFGVPATGREVDAGGQTFMRFAGGRLVERWNMLDVMTVLTQIGAVPAPG